MPSYTGAVDKPLCCQTAFSRVVSKMLSEKYRDSLADHAGLRMTVCTRAMVTVATGHCQRLRKPCEPTPAHCVSGVTAVAMGPLAAKACLIKSVASLFLFYRVMYAMASSKPTAPPWARSVLRASSESICGKRFVSSRTQSCADTTTRIPQHENVMIFRQDGESCVFALVPVFVAAPVECKISCSKWM